MLTLSRYDPLPVLCPSGHTTFSPVPQEIRKRTDQLVYGCPECYPDGYRQYRIPFSVVSKLFKEQVDESSPTAPSSQDGGSGRPGDP